MTAVPFEDGFPEIIEADPEASEPDLAEITHALEGLDVKPQTAAARVRARRAKRSAQLHTRRIVGLDPQAPLDAKMLFPDAQST